MKYVMYLFAVGTLAFAGCRSSQERINPSDSYPDLKTGNMSQGELMVHHELANLPVRKGVPPTLYTVFDEKGREVLESPTSSTMLPAGRYLVRLEGSPRKTGVFWVTVESGKTTHVDADRMKEGEAPAPVVD